MHAAEQLGITREAGVIKADRRIVTDETIFDLWIKHIFEGNWVYLAHESQVAEPGDYFTTSIGRQPTMITQDKDGGLHCLINACAHRGPMQCRKKRNNRKKRDNRGTLTCPFHGWAYRNDGTRLKVKDPEGAGNPENFDTNGSHDLVMVVTAGLYAMVPRVLDALQVPIEEDPTPRRR